MRAKDFLITETTLNEVDMSPSNLRQVAASIGATAGMEFEMIVPNVTVEGDREEDFDMDERASSFDNIFDFFNAGDDNSIRDVRTMIEGLRDGFWEYSSEIVSERFYSREGRKYFEEYVEDDFDVDAARETAREDISEANPELDTDSSEYAELVGERMEELKQEWLDSEWDDQGDAFERAREEFENAEYETIDESDYLYSQGWRYMSDIPYSDYDIFWPYYTEDSDNDATEAAESFSQAVGRKVNVSSSYHGERVEGEYTVEPDGSLSPDDSDDGGLEFVSPPLPLDEMLKDLNNTVAWAKEYGCYTNKSTGLHMNVSVPNFSRQNLDYVKLAILLGDEYILSQFGRLSNGYAASAMGKVKDIIQSSPAKAGAALEKMKMALAGEAAKIIHNGNTNKYTSINTKDGYIEFRSPGGDWLNEDIPKLENTLLRFVVALDAACDPEKHKQEYLKKLYKLLEPSMDEYGDMVRDFSNYVSGVGGAPEEVVKNFRRAALANLQKSNTMKKEKDADAAKHPEPIKWDILNAAGNPITHQVTARYQASAEEMARRYLLSVNPDINTSEFSVRPVQQATSTADNSENSWRISSNQNNETVQVLNARTRQEAIQQFNDWIMSGSRNVMQYRLRPPANT